MNDCLCDLGGVWDLDAVTGALTRFADASLKAALAQAVRQEGDRGALTHVGEGEDGPAPGLFCVAMGKHGAFELNYSSDIDFSIFYAPDRLPVAEGHEPQAVAVRIANHYSLIEINRTLYKQFSMQNMCCFFNTKIQLYIKAKWFK